MRSSRIVLLTAAALAACAAPQAVRPEMARQAAPIAPSPNALAASPHLALGIPRDADDSDDLLIDEHAYVVSFNPKSKVANWVAWRLDEHDFGDADRSGDFRADDRLPANAYHVTSNDYAHSGF